MVLQSLSEHTLSLQLLTLAQNTAAISFGPTHIQNAQALHQLTQAHFLSGDVPSALATSQEAYTIFKARLGEEHGQTKEVGKNVELLKAVVEGLERQKGVRERGLERIRQVAGSSRRRLVGGPSGGGSGLRGLDANGGGVVANDHGVVTNGGGPGVNGVATSGTTARGVVEEVSRIGERGHLDVDELVKFIQGPSKSARGKNSLRGKRRTGAKR